MEVLARSESSSGASAGETPARPRFATWRSILVGLVGVVLINLLTPFNNFVVNNTSLVGNHLPLALLLFYLFVTMAVNAPLTRFRPRWAMGRGELALALGMTLVGCAVPAVGLMRALPGHLTALWYHAASDDDARRLMTDLHLPDWLFPHMTAHDAAARGNDPVVREFFQGVPQAEKTPMSRLRAVPWAAWIWPAVAWGVFVSAMWGAILCVAVVFRRQWVENERLPFPLATVYLSLIEPPAPGRVLNPLMRSAGFWIAAVSVFLVQSLNALHTYRPQAFPQIPLTYDLGSVMTEPPLKWAEDPFKAQTVFFTIVGITYFVRSSLAFSLWVCFLIVQLARMSAGASGADITFGMETDQTFGAAVVVGAMVLFVARHHLAAVARQMFRGYRPGEPRGQYASYAVVGWVLVVCLATMIGWLIAAGTTLAGAAVTVGLFMLLMLVLMRIVAEGGLLYVVLPVPLNRPWIYLAQDVPAALSTRTSIRSFFFGTMFSGLLTHDTRESLAGFAPNALRVMDADRAMTRDDHRAGRTAWPVLLWLFAALLVAYVVGGGATLWAHYNYPTTLDRQQEFPIAQWGSYLMPKQIAIDGTTEYLPPRNGPIESHSRLAHFAIGAGVASTLAVLRLRFAAWPLDPLGYLLVYTWGLRQIWFSVFLGWLGKKLVVTYGGADLFRRARPTFLGLIIGESVAAGFWLIVSFSLAMTGHDYYMIHMLPI